MPRLLAGVALAFLLAACAGERAAPPPATVAETEAWAKAMFEKGAAARPSAQTEAAVAARCRAAGNSPGTLGFSRCRTALEERAAALLRAAALARIGAALSRAEDAADPLDGRQPAVAKTLLCYTPGAPRLVPCQDI